MSVSGKRAAFYLYMPEEKSLERVERAQAYEKETAIREQARAYCEKHGYYFDMLHVYEDIDMTRPALTWLKNAMEEGAFHLLLIPSLAHISLNMGHILNFLQDVQECTVEVVCLDPVPTRLGELGLSIVSLAQEHAALEAASLPEIIRLLRYR